MSILPPHELAALMPIAQRPDLIFESGAGNHLVDQHGRRYLDWVQGWGACALGHSPAVVVDAITRQAATLINPSPAFFNRPAAQLAQFLTANSVFDHVFFGSSGAEVNEGAIKLARKWGQIHRNGAHEIITFANAFHGRTLATMAASGKPGWDTLFAPAMPGFRKATLNNLASVEALINPNTVAIMLEPIQGEAGVYPASRAFVAGLAELCRRENLLLIVDEVQTDCGRTGELFHYQALGIAPDIMTLGKAIGGGTPLAALLANRRASCFAPGDQGGTYCGNALLCAVGLAVMRTIAAPPFLATVRNNGTYFATRLRALSSDLGSGEVRGSGFLLALELGADIAARVVTRAREAGLLINAPRSHCLRFMPALTISRDDIDHGLKILRTVLEQVGREQQVNNENRSAVR